jgi:hypothetical protein
MYVHKLKIPLEQSFQSVVPVIYSGGLQNMHIHLIKYS